MAHEELASRLRTGLVTLIDVRPAEEFAAGHIPGAVNIPLAELPRRIDELPADRAVIAYCRGPYCVFAFEAVAALRAEGYDARRLVDGYPEWWAAGRPVAFRGLGHISHTLAGAGSVLAAASRVAKGFFAPCQYQPVSAHRRALVRLGKIYTNL